MRCTFHLAFAKPAPELLWLPNYAGNKRFETRDTASPDELKDDLENTHTRMNWRSDSSRRNGATPVLGNKSNDLPKTFVELGLRNKWADNQKFSCHGN